MVPPEFVRYPCIGKKKRIIPEISLRTQLRNVRYMIRGSLTWFLISAVLPCIHPLNPNPIYTPETLDNPIHTYFLKYSFPKRCWASCVPKPSTPKPLNPPPEQHLQTPVGSCGRPCKARVNGEDGTHSAQALASLGFKVSGLGFRVSGF